MFERMKKRPELPDVFTLSEAQGPWASVGVGMVPVDGFQLRRGLRRWAPMDDTQDDGVEDWLVTDEDGGRRFPLSLQPDAYTKPSIARQFERLGRSPTPARILAFANRYGFLGSPVDLIDSDRKPGTTHVPVSDLISGEAVSHWQEETARFRDARETWRRLRDLSEGGPQRQHDAHAYLMKRIHWSPDGHVRYQSEIETRAGVVSFTRWVAVAADLEGGKLEGRFGHGDVAGPARLYVHWVVNEHIRGHVSPAVPAFLERPAMRNFPDSLMAAIYLRFALDLVSPSSRESICDYCHLPFAQGRRDKVYCSKNCKENARYHRITGKDRRPTTSF